MNVPLLDSNKPKRGRLSRPEVSLGIHPASSAERCLALPSSSGCMIANYKRRIIVSHLSSPFLMMRRSNALSILPALTECTCANEVEGDGVTLTRGRHVGLYVGILDEIGGFELSQMVR